MGKKKGEKMSKTVMCISALIWLAIAVINMYKVIKISRHVDKLEKEIKQSVEKGVDV